MTHHNTSDEFPITEGQFWEWLDARDPSLGIGDLFSPCECVLALACNDITGTPGHGIMTGAHEWTRMDFKFVGKHPTLDWEEVDRFPLPDWAFVVAD